jgi:signal transduction histidine kinase
VFESFGQGRHDAVIADQGTGLGLPIVKGLAEAHEGRVTLESLPAREPA